MPLLETVEAFFDELGKRNRADTTFCMRGKYLLVEIA